MRDKKQAEDERTDGQTGRSLMSETQTQMCKHFHIYYTFILSVRFEQSAGHHSMSECYTSNLAFCLTTKVELLHFGVTQGKLGNNYVSIWSIYWYNKYISTYIF